MPVLVRLYLRQSLLGLALGLIFSMGLVALDVARLGHLFTAVDGGWWAFAIFAALNGLVFAGVAFGVTVIRMPYETR